MFIGLNFGQNYLTCSFIKDSKKILYKKYIYNNYELYNSIIFNYFELVNNIADFIKALKIYDIKFKNYEFIISLPDLWTSSFEHAKSEIELYNFQEQLLFDNQNFLYKIGFKNEFLAQYYLLGTFLTKKINIINYIIINEFLAQYYFFLNKQAIGYIPKEPFSKTQEDIIEFAKSQELSIEYGLYFAAQNYESIYHDANKFF